MNKDSYKIPGSSMAPSPAPKSTMTLITEQLSEVVTQTEVLVIDAIAHILAAHVASEAMQYDQPMWLAKPCHQLRFNSQPKKITTTGIANSISLIENSIAQFTSRISSYKPKKQPSSFQTTKAERLLLEEINILASASFKGHKQLKRLTSEIKATELYVEAIPLPEDMRFKEIEASMRRLVLISDSILFAVDCTLYKTTARKDSDKRQIALEE